ncbi:MAG: hypothetical protein IPK07_24375 [Deltaproteobacteria bacterium]|jgi:hypothetical protein|nr:hypothetical protein [Deltaproteobacteria bacterium]
MGSAKNIPSEGGSGGKRGHSNMEHWFFTEEIKDAARVRRRQDDKNEVREGAAEATESSGASDLPTVQRSTRSTV